MADIELPPHIAAALISDDPGGSGVKVIRYRQELWRTFTDEDKERCISYWRRMYSTDYTHLVVITEPDETDMLLADGEQEIVYQENMKKKPGQDFATSYASQYSIVHKDDKGYWERNILVRLLAKLFKGGLVRTDIEGWDADWHNGVMIHIPGIGQVSWHFHDSELPLFADLPPCQNPYNGHTTEDKYKRIISYARS